MNRRRSGMITVLSVALLAIVAGAIAAGLAFVRYDAQRTDRLEHETQARLLLTAAAVGGEPLELPGNRGTVTIDDTGMTAIVNGHVRHAR
ncbi:MAG: hypothetical protein AAF743_08425 [Planctomycetota bacterium]